MSAFLNQLKQETKGMTLDELAPYLQRQARTMLRAGDWERAQVCDQLARQARIKRHDKLREMAELESID